MNRHHSNIFSIGSLNDELERALKRIPRLRPLNGVLLHQASP